MTVDELLAALIDVLRELQTLVPEDKAAWDQDRVTRLAAERLWITAGNLAEMYRLEALVAGPGVEPWPELVTYWNKLSHALPGDLSSDRVYADTVTDLTRLLAEVQEHRGRTRGSAQDPGGEPLDNSIGHALL